MLNESSVGNVSFRNIPAEKRIGLRIGGVGLTLQQNTWNDLVRLAGDIGVIRPNVENQNDAVDGDDKNNIAEDEKMQTDEEEAIEESEQGTENDESLVF